MYLVGVIWVGVYSLKYKVKMYVLAFYLLKYSWVELLTWFKEVFIGEDKSIEEWNKGFYLKKFFLNRYSATAFE